MGMDIIRNAVNRRFVQWGRGYNDNYDLAVFANDRHIGMSVITFGQYEKVYLENTSQVLHKLTHGDDYKKGICLDIGANIGNHALFYSYLFKKVIAFEPNPVAYKLMESSVLKNQIENIEIIKAGLGSHKRKESLSVCNSNLGASSILNDLKTDRAFNMEIEVDVGDDLLQDMLEDRAISFIKLDVEGFEAEALKGLCQTIKRDCPVIAIELNFSTHPETTMEAVEVLRDSGYRNFYVLDRTKVFQNKYIDFMYRVVFGVSMILSKLDDFENNDYLQIFCTV